MVQAEVAARLAAGPGSRDYGAPSVKVAWWTRERPLGKVGSHVFWPAPNVQSGLVGLRRRHGRDPDLRGSVFAAVDAAFAQRRKMLRGALRGWAAPADPVEVLRAAGIDPELRGESLDVDAFSAVASAKSRLLSP